jgi:hypothetical protein
VFLSTFCCYILTALVAEEVHKDRILSEEDIALKVDSNGTAKWKSDNESKMVGELDQPGIVSKGPDGMFVSTSVSHCSATLCLCL